MEYFTDFMAHALAEAQAAMQADEVPVGAVIVSQAGEIVSSAQNRMRRDNDATAHAEMLAIKKAMEKLGCSRLEGYDLWVTLEPCAMCAGAIGHARLRRLYFAAYDAKSGAVEHGPCLFQHATMHHHPEIIGGIQQSEAAALLKDFFEQKR